MTVLVVRPLLAARADPPPELAVSLVVADTVVLCRPLLRSTPAAPVAVNVGAGFEVYVSAPVRLGGLTSARVQASGADRVSLRLCNVQVRCSP